MLYCVAMNPESVDAYTKELEFIVGLGRSDMSDEDFTMYSDMLNELREQKEDIASLRATAIDPTSLQTYSASEAGWYQSAAGELYHYDGIIWDEVPPSGLKLEFLGC